MDVWSFDKEVTDEITPWSRFLIDKLRVPQLNNKFTTFYGTRIFIPFSQ
jgi:hypothetical protein